MKLNGVIILTHRHLKDFFSFAEFWKKREEFKEVANKKEFFKRNDESKKQLKREVFRWIDGDPLTSSHLLTSVKIEGPGFSMLRMNTGGCEKELKYLSKEEAFGVVALYEMMGRKLRLDIFEVLSSLGHELINPLSDVILFQNTAKYTFEAYQGRSGQQEETLRNVPIVNLSQNRSCSITLGDTSLCLQPGKCTRALFSEDKCIHLFPVQQEEMTYCYRAEKHTTGLERRGVVLCDNVVPFAVGKLGYVYATPNAPNQFVAKHQKIGDLLYENQIQKDEQIIYLALNEKETECLLLTDHKRLYLNKDDEIRLYAEHVAMASYENGQIKIVR